jgi:UDP-N-acetylglucosamine 2-epimerase (non-hydrolysing)
MKIISVVGARPNFMKIAPFIEAIKRHNQSGMHIDHLLVHTGQHYDDRMSKDFFRSLNIPEADINLNIGSGTHAEQVGYTMIAFEKVLMEKKPDWVVLVGDVNATLACSVTAKKLHINVCHIEAGLRSGDLTMPEEINRLVTDRLSDLLLTPDELSSENLAGEGVDSERVVQVGNIMIDTLTKNLEKAKQLTIADILKDNLHEAIGENQMAAFKQETPSYALLTMHRPSNVDQKSILEDIVNFLIGEVAQEMYLLWSVHPRTEKQLKTYGLFDSIIDNPRLVLLKPLGYHSMLRLNLGATIMLTDSGGLQEECCVVGTPCLTLRWNTERPVTLRENGGLSVLVGNDIKLISDEFTKTVGQERKAFVPPLWDGQTADRCLKSILNFQANV